MESRKVKQEEMEKRIEEMREQRRAKEKARLDKLRTLNMQKYHVEDKPSSVFHNTKPPAEKSRPKNFNSMTDLRRQSMLPKPTAKVPKSAPLQKKHVANGNTVSITNNTAEPHPEPKLDVNGSHPTGDTDKALIKPIEEMDKSKSVAFSNEMDGNIKTARTVNAPKRSIVAPKDMNKISVKVTGAEKPKQLRQSMAAAPNQGKTMVAASNLRKSLVAGPSKILPVKKNVPETLSLSEHSRVAVKKQLPLFSLKSESVLRATGNEIKTTITKDQQSKTESKTPSSRISVFERLYKPKNQPVKLPVSQRKETIFEQKNRLVAALVSSRRSFAPAAVAQEKLPKMRRSISAVHLKRLGKDELKNCYHHHGSLSEGLDKIDLASIDEDETNKPQVVSMVRSERKKTVKFQNATPRADELERKLRSWLLKRGKSIDSFQHLRCFSVDRLAPSEKGIFNVEPYDDENKENVAVEVDEDGMYLDVIKHRNDFEEVKTKWRRASSFNDSEVYSDCTETADKSLVSTETPSVPVDELLLGALTDLTQLVRDGYDWEQCARWLRAIRERSPLATELAAYWECRAAFEECRGNLPRTCLCWEEAIAKGTDTSVVEASLDQLLDKFMQLNISPGSRSPLGPREMQCAKSVFRSSLIRFAVRNARAKNESAKYTVTPVRRSSRISGTPGAVPRAAATPAAAAPAGRGARTPLLQLAASLRLIDDDIRDKSTFVPNKLLQYSP